MHATWERTALQQAADQVVVRGSLKASGIALTIFGAVGLFAGVLPPFDLLMVSVGAALALCGLWNLTNPSTVGLALVAGSMTLVGLYNIGSGFLDAANGVRPFVGWQVLGVWQVIWGWQGFGRWKRFQGALDQTVSDEQRKQAKAMLDQLKKTPPRKSPDVVEWITGGMTPQIARARLMQDTALVLIAGGDDVRVVSRPELDVEAPDAKPGKNAKVTIRMSGVESKATMTAESLQRLRTWKQSSVGLQQRAA